MFKFITQFFRRKKQVKDDPWFNTILTKPIREKFVISVQEQQEQQEQMTVTREFLDDLDQEIKLEECIHQCLYINPNEKLPVIKDENTFKKFTYITENNQIIKEIVKPV